MKILRTSLLSLLFSYIPLTYADSDSAKSFFVHLSGAQEVPSVNTDTTGRAILHIDQNRTTIRFDIDISKAEQILEIAGAHLHCAPAGANGPVVAFLAGQTSPGRGFDGKVGFYATLVDDSIIDPVCGETISDLVDSMIEGNVYVNVHSAANPAGEIRGQIQAKGKL